MADDAPVERSAELPGPIRLPYVEQGDASGVPLVLLHAVGDSWRSFGRVLPHLPGSLHVFAVTQRGHGDASRPADGYSPREYATDLAAFLDAIHVPAAVVVGGSSGGFVARRFAVDQAERTLGLVMLGSPASLRDKQVALDLWESTVSTLTDPVDPAFVRAFAESTLSQPVPPAFVESMVQESLKVPARVWTATVRGLLEDDSLAELGAITAPTLIVWGERDAVLPRSDQETLRAAIPCSRLVVYPGAGHAVYWEEPARVAADIAAFVAGLPGREAQPGAASSRR